ncbi:MAG: hypothetical protein IPG92_07395 [Flavobacteriales bacterium]|nr:hypothetical protein [Flavobacteriales bacterium]
MQATKLFQDLFASERTGGMLLIVCSALSLAITNLGGHGYAEVWHADIAGRPLEFWVGQSCGRRGTEHCGTSGVMMHATTDLRRRSYPHQR